MVSGTQTRRYLTYSPLTKKLRSGEYELLSIMAYALRTQLTIKHKWYRSGMSPSTQTYSYASTVVDGRITTVVSVPSGESLSATTKIEVWAEYGGNVVTEVRTFVPDFTVRKKETRFGWLNSLGGIDHYTFTGTRSSEAQAEKVLYTRDLPAGFLVSNRGESVASVTPTQEYEVISDFETEDTYQWLVDIINSPEVWIVEDDQVIPVIVTSKSHPVESDSLFQFKIKYHKSSDKIVQNG